jgi:hypothetical protein
MRYDKAQNLTNVSPRVSLVYSGGESRRHNFRGHFKPVLETIYTRSIHWF